MGSLLILAGVAGLVFSGAKTAGLLLLILMAVVFYGGGILLRNNETLKIASYVFVGTGMMIVPFIGVLVYDLTKIEPSVVWLIMSLIGVPLYIVATYVMNSRIFSYFAILGFVSLSCSLASVMSLALVWYFVFVMMLGLIFDVLMLTGVVKKCGVMQEAIEITGEWLPLAVLGASAYAVFKLSIFDYVIMVGVVLLQLIMNYLRNPVLWREILLRVGIPFWVILLTRLFTLDIKITGLVLAGLTLIETLFSFFKCASESMWKEAGRKETETVCIIACMVLFLVSGILIGISNEAVPAWCSFALVVDSTIVTIARFVFKNNVWYLGLIIIGAILPFTITNALNISLSDASPILALVYLAEMAGMETLFWRNKDREGDVYTLLSIGIFGIAAIIAGWHRLPVSLELFAIALAFWLRGYRTARSGLKEAALYFATFGAYCIITYLNANLGLGIKDGILWIIFAHFALAGSIAGSLLWDGKEPPHTRLVLGSMLLLIVVGCAAISGTSWAMYLFLAEAVAVLLYGTLMKDAAMRITGAVGAFLAVLWFTKDLSFVWPIILGLGIIGTVVFVLIKNSQKTPPKPNQNKK